MAFFTVTTNDESVRDYSGESSYINKSGIYEVTIKYIVVNTSPNGSTYLDLYIDYNGKMQPIFQAMRLTNNDGQPNLGANVFNKLCIIAGATKGSDINDPVSKNLPIGKGGEVQECMVLEDFEDMPVYIHIHFEYSIYNDKIKESKIVRNFFRYEDKATASEIINDVENKGSQYAKEIEYAAEKTTYKDGLTEEDVKTWIANRRSGGTTTTSKPSISFSKKRTFGKKD